MIVVSLAWFRLTATNPSLHHFLISECYLAGTQYSRHAVAVSQGELDLDIDPPRSLPRDPSCPQPVVLAGAHHVTHLINSYVL